MPFTTIDIIGLADLASETSRKRKVPMVEAIRSVAKRFDVSSADIAKELSRRAQSPECKRRRFLSRQGRLAEKLHAENEELYKDDALAHEEELQESFILAGHLDDY